MIRLAGTYAHLCSAIGWRFMDERSAEFYRCRCFEPTADFLAFQDQAAVKKDLERGAGPSQDAPR